MNLFTHPSIAGLAKSLLGLAAVGALTSLPMANAATPPLHPNIVFILVDDLGTDWVGCYGADHPTPNVDRLAGQGVRFETAWTCPICTPSRVSLLTGLYSGHTGWTEHYDVPRWGGAGLIPDRFATWPQILRNHGYVTTIVGKWQINDLRQSPTLLRDHGFDSHCVWTGVEKDNPASEKRYWDPFLQIDGQRGTHAGQYGPDICQAYAFDFLRKNKDRPFLLYYPMIAVHDPIEPTPLNRNHPPTAPTALLADAVTYTDRQIGELMDELHRLGLAENTIVIFAGDNGSSASGLVRGRRVPVGKGRTTDWGVHIPLIIRAPMVTPGGWVAPELTDFTDLFPTLLEAAGIPRTGYLLDGVSLLPVLRRSADAVPRQWVYAQRDRSRTVRDRRYKLNSTGELFDLQADPDEKTPLPIKGSPTAEKAYQALSAVFAQIPADASSPPFPGYTAERMREYMNGPRK